MVSSFNLRVYGILIDGDSVLITDEHRAGMLMTKFPGGGLEFGEGLADGLIREFEEELAIKIQVDSIFYVNDFLQISSFNPKDQLLSFYYFVQTNELDKIPVPIEKTELMPGDQAFRWVKLSELDSAEFTFPIDKIVVDLLKTRT